MPKRLAISLPVFNEPHVLEFQLRVIKLLVPESVVVLHVSASSEHGFLESVRNLASTFSDFVIVNPERLPTRNPNPAHPVSNLASVHLSNIEFAWNEAKPDIIAFASSNELLVRPGLQQYFETYDYGCQVRIATREGRGIGPQHYRNVRDSAGSAMEEHGVEDVVCSQIEGCWFPSHALLAVAKALDGYGLLSHECDIFPTFSLAINKDLKEAKRAEPYIYFVARESVTREEVDDVRSGKKTDKFGVKRVPRKTEDPVRQYIVSKITGDLNAQKWTASMHERNP